MASYRLGSCLKADLGLYSRRSSISSRGINRSFNATRIINLSASTRKAPGSGLRRRRIFPSQVKVPIYGSFRTDESFGNLSEPYKFREDDLESYLQKTSLSPWVPLPDAVARKVFDLAMVTPEDKHVDLGSGDGRVCFHALQFGVASSIGIDVDEGIVNVAKERLSKRHPAPENLSFLVADLLDDTESAWKHVQEASIITMYFATEALEMFRPLLERKLAGHKCKIITCGYEMPGWSSVVQEVVLGTQIYLYQWGETDAGNVSFDDDFLFHGPDILSEKPKELADDFQNQKYEGQNIVDRTSQYPIRGFNPGLFQAAEDDDEEALWNEESDDEHEKESRQS